MLGTSEVADAVPAPLNLPLVLRVRAEEPLHMGGVTVGSFVARRCFDPLPARTASPVAAVICGQA